jgi:hypothetical protein
MLCVENQRTLPSIVYCRFQPSTVVSASENIMQREFPLADARKPELTDKAVEPSSPMEQW